LAKDILLLFHAGALFLVISGAMRTELVLIFCTGAFLQAFAFFLAVQLGVDWPNLGHFFDDQALA
jgi:hypothetical protein